MSSENGVTFEQGVSSLSSTSHNLSVVYVQRCDPDSDSNHTELYRIPSCVLDNNGNPVVKWWTRGNNSR